MLTVGQQLGEYLIERPISVGMTGQADVYLARRADGTTKPIALKVLAEHLKSNSEALRSFTDEADILTKLNHPGIVRLESFDTSPPTPYIAQEYVEGQSIAEWLKNMDGPAPIAAVISIAIQVADALSYAHNLPYFRVEDTKTGGKSSKKCQGLIHRDLSTDNILITGDDLVKLIDFGIARAVGIRTVTTRNTSLGKEYYVAPEVEIGVGRTSLPAADIYSFGICLYEMVMMRRPEKQRIDVLKQFQRNLHALNAAFPDDVPEGLKRLIAHCVQREPRDRPASMDEVKAALLEVQAKGQATETVPLLLPPGITLDSKVLKLVRILALAKEETASNFVGLTINEDGSRYLLLCDERTKICSFNEMGGEKQTRHVPRGQNLAVLAGGKGDEAYGFPAERVNLLVVGASGEWRSLGEARNIGSPRVVPDNLVYRQGSVFMGDYCENRILRVSSADAQIVAATPEGVITQLGPFGLGRDALFFVDMASKTIYRTDLSLQSVHSVCAVQAWDWPTSLAVGDNLLAVVDSQKRTISVLAQDGDILAPQALTWDGRHEISQVLFAPGSSRLVLVDTALPALLFFDVVPVDPELMRLAKALRLSPSRSTEYSYESIEDALIDTLRKSANTTDAAFRAIAHIDNSRGTGQKGLRIKAAVYRYLLENRQDPQRAILLRSLSETLEQLGEREQSRTVCQEFFEGSQGFDPDMRERFGRLLEREAKWYEIKEFEGKFLSQSYFDSPE